MSYDAKHDNGEKYIEYHLKGRVKEQLIDDHNYKPIMKDGKIVREKLDDRVKNSDSLGKQILLKMIELDPDKRLDVPGILNSDGYGKYISALKKAGKHRKSVSAFYILFKIETYIY